MDGVSDVRFRFRKGDRVFVVDDCGKRLFKAVVENRKLSKGLEEYTVVKENGEAEAVCGIYLKEV